MDLSNSYDSFRKAWNLLSFFKFPETGNEKREGMEDIPDNIIIYFPAVGAAIGFAAYCSSWLLDRLMDGKIFSAMLSAVIITLALEILTLGKDLAILMNFLKVMAKNAQAEEAFSIIEDKENPIYGISDLVLLFSLFLMKIICIGILIYSGNALWLVVMLTLPYLIQGLVAVAPSSIIEGSILPSDRDTVKNAWIVAGIICIVAGAGQQFIPAVLLALILSWFFLDRFQRFWISRFKTITGKTVGLAGIMLEYILLIAGTILLAKQ